MSDLPSDETADKDCMSGHLLDPHFNAAAIAGTFGEKEFGALDLDVLMDVLAHSCRRVAGGDLSDVEAMLLTQAHALQAIFTALALEARRTEHYHRQVEIRLRLALKAQSQCRATLEALAALKNPRPVAFVAQANIANGPQQVNNFSATAPGDSGTTGNRPNELLEDQHGQRMDTGTAREAGRAHSELAAVATVNGATDGGR